MSGKPRGTPGASSTRRKRTDAEENRARIVAVAREVVASADELKLNEVAKRAGVGQGTLYRHFPGREHLLAEVYRHEVDELVTAAPTLLAEHDPVTALARWFDHVAAYARVKHGVMAAVEVGIWRDLTTQSLGPIGDAITLMLDAGAAEGSIRRDVNAHDVITLIGFLAHLDAASSAERAHHLLAIVLDGLRSRGGPDPCMT